jgi:hypothetical protein
MMKFAKSLVLAAAALLPLSAHAGNRLASPVMISTAMSTAVGAVGAARNSSDNYSSIECSVTVSSSSAPSVHCTATNAANTTVSCSSSSPQFVSIASAVKGDSYIMFAWDSQGQCTWLSVANGSAYEPKQ